MENVGCTRIRDQSPGGKCVSCDIVNAVKWLFHAPHPCRFIHRVLFFVQKVVKYYSIFGALNLSILIVMPVLRNVHELPFLTWAPYDVQKSLVLFYLHYAFHFGNALYAGGGNIAVNMFVYTTLVVIEYFLNLLGARLQRLGNVNGRQNNMNAQHKQSCYRDIISCVKLHLQIDR